MTDIVSDVPKLRIFIPDGRSIFTKVTLDGKDVRATRVSFDSGDSQALHGLVKVTLEFYPDIEVEGDIPLRTERRTIATEDTHAIKRNRGDYPALT